MGSPHMVKDIDSSDASSRRVPVPPPLPRKDLSRRVSKQHHSVVPNETKELWNKIFEEGFGTDVRIVGGDGVLIDAHYVVLSAASPVLRNSLKKSKVKNGIRYLRVPGVPSEALRVFICFLYSSSYEKDEMMKFALHLLVLSHAFAVPALKRICQHHFEREEGCLTKENVIDVLQLSKLCDAPRLSLICNRTIIKDFEAICATESWKAMKQIDPSLEKELIEMVVEADSAKQERQKKAEERKVYIQLQEAMEALQHICDEGCRTIGPRDRAPKPPPIPCRFPACKVVEALIRHFYGCKMRVPGGCVHCKRMWQLLELHSRMCRRPEFCRVPLCGHFKGRVERRSKREETKWNLLVRKVEAAKNRFILFR